MSTELASAHAHTQHTQTLFVYVAGTQKHNSSASVWVANMKMHFDNIDAGTQLHAQKYVHQVPHIVNRRISKINKYM